MGEAINGRIEPDADQILQKMFPAASSEERFVDHEIHLPEMRNGIRGM